MEKYKKALQKRRLKKAKALGSEWKDINQYKPDPNSSNILEEDLLNNTNDELKIGSYKNGTGMGSSNNMNINNTFNSMTLGNGALNMSTNTAGNIDRNSSASYYNQQ